MAETHIYLNIYVNQKVYRDLDNKNYIIFKILFKKYNNWTYISIVFLKRVR